MWWEQRFACAVKWQECAVGPGPFHGKCSRMQHLGWDSKGKQMMAWHLCQGPGQWQGEFPLMEQCEIYRQVKQQSQTSWSCLCVSAMSLELFRAAKGCDHGCWR